MKNLTRYLSLAVLIAAAPCGHAVIIFSQNFDTSPVNYTLPGISDPFRIDTIDAGRYWGLSNMGMTLDPVITGDSTTYLAGRNMNNDGDGFTLTFDQNNPAQIDFSFAAFGNIDLKLSVDLAGAPSAEPENFLRAFVDADGDTLYETPIFNFAGTGNTAYIDPTLGTLSAAFATFSNIPLPPSTAPDGRLRLRFEMFNDTNSPSGPASEAEGLDNIVVTGLIPEPTTSLLLLSGLVASAHRRRRRR